MTLLNKTRCLPSLALLTVAASLLGSSAVLAHPGHGIGVFGHGLDHALWNFAGFVVLCAVVLAVGRLGRNDKK